MRCLRQGTGTARPHTPHRLRQDTLYRVAGQDYCRHHIIRAAVADDVITEIRVGTGPAVPMCRECPSVEAIGARHHTSPTSDDAVRAGPQDPGEPVLAGARSPGGMDHHHSCRQAGGEGGLLPDERTMPV